LYSSESAAPTCYQVEDENDECYYQEKMNQSSSDMQAESQQPQDQQDDKNSRKHGAPSRVHGCLKDAVAFKHRQTSIVDY
jgi:hypothetical protein